MKAVIMAGGEGSRIRPLTCDMPKPMAPLLCRPIIEYILDLLLEHGVTEAHVTTQYLPNMISGYFEAGQYKNIKLSFFEEKEPLGTAGSVKNAAKDFYDDFIVISGDALCDFNISKAVEFHKQNQSTATLIVTKVDDPREYGLVDFDSEGKITGFTEKPDYSQATTNQANTGIYILSPHVLSFIPDNTFYDFGKDVFAELLAKKEALYAYSDSGYWCDIGDLQTYASSQFDMMNGRVNFKRPKYHRHTGDFLIIEPCYIEDDVTIGSNAVIGPNTVISRGVKIGKETKIRDSIIHSNAYIGQKATITGAVVCKGASIKDDASVFEGAVIGTSARVGIGATVAGNVKIWPQKAVLDYAEAKENVKFGICRSEVFDDKGICGEVGVEITPEYLAKLGSAVGSLKNVKKVGVSSSADKAANALKRAFLSGLQSSGAAAWDFGSCFEGMHNFALQFCGLDIGVFLSTGAKSFIKIKCVSGLPLKRGLEREIEAMLSRNEFKRCSWDKYKDVVEMPGIRHLYINEVMKCVPQITDDSEITVETQNQLIKSAADEVLQKLCAAKGDKHLLSISREGDRAAYYGLDKPPVWHEQLLALACLDEFIKGNDVALSYDAPSVIDAIATNYGQSVIRYLSCPSDESDSEARKLASKQLWVRDALMLCLKVFSFSRRQGKEIDELLLQIPEFSVITRQIDLSCSACDLLNQISDNKDINKSKEGVVFKKSGATLQAKSNKRGDALKIAVEANSMEIANEIADNFDKLAKLQPQTKNISELS